MMITSETKGYNERRYGKPWIAVVDFSKTVKGDYAWGNWTGDHYNGGAGVLVIDANHDDIVAMGQKDFRNSRNSAPAFYFLDAGGNLVLIGDKGAAYKYYLDQKGAAPDRDALTKEKDNLLARLAEIDILLKQ